MLRFQHVDKFYPPHQDALRNIDLSVAPGEFVFIAGASGAGKSTLLKLIFGAERASRGELHVDGRDLIRADRREIAELRRSVGVIFQDYKLLTNRTLLENVAFSLEIKQIKKRERFQWAYRLLAALGLKDRIHALPPTLSGGEQQRVSIARALAMRPKIILADEPTGNLDPDMAQAVFNLLLEANKYGATVMVATHNLPLIEAINRRTLVLDRGKIIGDFAKPGG